MTKNYDNHLYTKCAKCHLFVDENPAAEDAPDTAPLIHLARGDEADEALDASHEPEASEMTATLDVWRRYGPPEMRARFLDWRVEDALTAVRQAQERSGDYLAAIDDAELVLTNLLADIQEDGRP